MPEKLRERFQQISQKDLSVLTSVIALVVFGLGVLSTYIYVSTVENRQLRDLHAAEDQQLRGTIAYAQNKLVSYRQILLAGATAVNIKGNSTLTRADWKQYYETNYIRSAFPSLLGVGFATYIPAENLETYLQTIRAEGFTDFAVSPRTPRSEYTAITYIEPFNEVNRKAFGHDMFTEPIRNAAMKQARDTGTFAVTAPVVLKQDEAKNAGTPPKSVLMYYAVYDGGSRPTETNERRQKLVGYVYAAFRIEDLLKERRNDLSKLGIGYTVQDVTNATKPVLLQQVSSSHDGKLNNVKDTFDISSRKWSLTLSVPTTVSGKQADPFALFLFGLGASTMLGVITYTLLRLRIRSMHTRHEGELEKTRNELLALSSHQLRTPASGVKQYIGMLLQGYFGELTDEQKEIAEKAYSSNDRQLEIIDQLLYVAKADANQLIVHPERVDLAALTTDIVESMHDTAAKKQLTLTTKLPKELSILADERFLRMIIENLISNAIKYSYEHSSVLIRVHTDDEEAVLTVTDSGVGVDEADRAKLFKKFSRIQNDLSTKEGGSGLGLYLAQKLAQAHGGSITISSPGAKGSRFTLRIPRYTKTAHNVIQLTE